MKNINRYLLLVLMLCCSFVKTVFAEELSFTMSASADKTEVVAGEEAVITVGLQSSSVITSCSFNIDNGSTLEFVSKNGLNNWNFDSVGTTISDSSSDKIAYEEGKNIFNLTYKVNGNGKVTIKNIECSSPSDSEEGTSEIKGSFNDISVDFTVKNTSDDTTLSSLKVTGGTLAPEFSSNVYEYIVTLDNTNFSLELTSNNVNYQDKIIVYDTEGKKLDPNNITFKNDGGQGLMYIKIIINGNEDKPYELTAKYEQETLDNSLASLKINGKVIELKDGKTDYVIDVSSDVMEVNVEAVLKDSDNFEFREGNEAGTFKISDGTTSIALIIVPKSSQSGAASKTYLIDIVKEGNHSSSPPSSSSSNNGNTNSNPSTGGISLVLMILILISSLIGSIFLYQKKLESYK